MDGEVFNNQPIIDKEDDDLFNENFMEDCVRMDQYDERGLDQIIVDLDAAEAVVDALENLLHDGHDNDNFFDEPEELEEEEDEEDLFNDTYFDDYRQMDGQGW
ncbi:PREDICTED: DNA replication licensing factor MCM2 [Camelina sativa]|uniref:DNA replication licensing factor MCM2 n=1 Tax=Camelina sativa TaxID=90675 RepID=A0ABM1RSX4_CAMSA|nr:PREDICTED: DNA replication licensing factor MCM2 [Camelina sativa]